jgi:hypothetical protein
VFPAYFQVISRHLPGRFQKKKMKNLSENDVTLCRNEGVTYRKKVPLSHLCQHYVIVPIKFTKGVQLSLKCGSELCKKQHFMSLWCQTV